VKPIDPIDDELIRELRESLAKADPAEVAAFKRRLERAVAIVEALVFGAESIGTTPELMLSAVGEVFARAAARMELDSEREAYVERWIRIIRKRVEFLALRYASEGARDAAKH
jgi:hypothetical protein